MNFFFFDYNVKTAYNVMNVQIHEHDQRVACFNFHICDLLSCKQETDAFNINHIYV